MTSCLMLSEELEIVVSSNPFYGLFEVQLRLPTVHQRSGNSYRKSDIRYGRKRAIRPNPFRKTEWNFCSGEIPDFWLDGRQYHSIRLIGHWIVVRMLQTTYFETLRVEPNISIWTRDPQHYGVSDQFLEVIGIAVARRVVNIPQPAKKSNGAITQ